MTAVTYTAKRSLIPGHSANTSYSMDLLVVALPTSRQVSNERQEAIDGTRETIRLYVCEIWDITLAIAYGTRAAQIKEFLDSVEDGEVFTFDPYGTANTPNNPLSAEIESKGYNRGREPRGQGGATDGFRFSFQVRVMV